MSKNTLFLVGMVASIGVGVAAAAKDLPPPWSQILMIGGLAGTAINGFLAQRPREEWSAQKRQEKRTDQDTDRLLEEE
jgi:hypothetical protein